MFPLTRDTVSQVVAPKRLRWITFGHYYASLGIVWPMEPVEISAKDRGWPAFDPAFHGVEAFRRTSPRAA